MSVKIINELKTRLKDVNKSLSPIFGSLQIEGKSHKSARTYAARSLSTLENIVLDKKDNNPEEGFEKDEKRLAQLGDYSTYHFIQKYGCRVPSDAQQDVSYFDHWRIKTIQENKSGKGWLLIKGDLMGIQDFIYGDIPIENPGSGRKLAKKLRGKSFFISVLTDFLAEMFLHQLDLPMVHLLFAGGGHFNLLVPDDKKDMVADLSKHLNTILRQKFNQKINLIVATVECNDTILEQKASVFMKEVNEKRDALKYQQHHGYLSDIFKEKASNKNKDEEDDFFAKIGQALPKSLYLIQLTTSQKVDFKQEDFVQVLELPCDKDSNQHRSLWLCKSEEHTSDEIRLFLKRNKYLNHAEVIRMNDFDFLEFADDLKILPNVDFGFRLIGQNAPISNEKDEDTGENLIADFEEIANLNFEFDKNSTDKLTPLVTDKKGEYAPIYGKLSAVRLDIDDLGFIFSKGFPTASLEQIAALSRELNLFFSGYINHLAEKYGIYVVYSGGDDAFVVGNWKAMMLFMNKLNVDFKRFVNNPDVHFSAGIFMCDARFPVLRFYKESGELQKNAKDAHDDKNQIQVFNNIMHWDDYDYILRFADKILLCTEGDEKLTRALLFRVLALIKRGYSEREIFKNDVTHKVGSLNVPSFNRNVANLHYLFAKHDFTQEKIKETQGMISREVVSLILKASKNAADKQTILENYMVALQYAILTLRESKN